MKNTIERVIVPYNSSGNSLINKEQYSLFAPIAARGKVGMASYDMTDFDIQTQKVSLKTSVREKINAVPSKLDKVQSLLANTGVYTQDSTGTVTLIELSEAHVPHSIVQRDIRGGVRVVTEPKDDNDAVSYAYLKKNNNHISKAITDADDKVKSALSAKDVKSLTIINTNDTSGIYTFKIILNDDSEIVSTLDLPLEALKVSKIEDILVDGIPHIRITFQNGNMITAPLDVVFAGSIPGIDTTVEGQAAFALGYKTRAIGSASVASGIETEALGRGTFTMGLKTKATRDYLVALGTKNEDLANNLLEIGFGMEDTNGRIVGKNIFEVTDEGTTKACSYTTRDASIGYKREDELLTFDYVRGAIASGLQSVAFGGQRYDKRTESVDDEPQTEAKGIQSFAAGGGVVVDGAWSAGFGKDTSTLQKTAFASGGGTRAGCTEEQYEKYQTWQREDNPVYADSHSFAHSEGSLTKALGKSSHAEGNYGLAIGYTAHAEGQETVAIGKYSHAEGLRTIAGGDFEEGFEDTATAPHKTANVTITTDGTIGKAAHAEGYKTKAINDYSHAEGWETDAVGKAAHAEGYKNDAIGDYAHAEGYKNVASGEAAHAEGYDTEASGKRTHAEGGMTVASGEAAHAEGYKSEAIGTYSHAEGQETNAEGLCAHAEGGGTRAIGIDSHAEGQNTSARGDYSHAEGQTCCTYGNISHAEGFKTTAVGIAAHAEGYSQAVPMVFDKLSLSEILTKWQSGNSTYKGTIAAGQGSHAEGLSSLAYGKYSHTEGSQTLAKGEHSHAGGNKSVANNNGSFAHGDNVTANANYQVVFGKYNEPNIGALFVIGNGTSATKSNAFMVMPDGTASSSNKYCINAVDTIEGHGDFFYEAASVSKADIAHSSLRYDGQHVIQDSLALNSGGFTAMSTNFQTGNTDITTFKLPNIAGEHTIATEEFVLSCFNKRLEAIENGSY